MAKPTIFPPHSTHCHCNHCSPSPSEPFGEWMKVRDQVKKFQGELKETESKFQTEVNELEQEFTTVKQDVQTIKEKADSIEFINAEEVNEKIGEVSEQLADNAPGTLGFIKRLTNGDVRKIKLIGDSVTAGAQSKGYNIPNDGRIILTGSRFNNGGTGFAREPGTNWATFPSWANLFRKYINTNYSDIDFFNAGVGGIALKEVLENYLSQLITSDEDVLFIMLGLNDRATYDIAVYETNMRTLLDYAKERSNFIVLMSPPPTTSEFVNGNPTDGLKTDYKFGSREINDVCLKLSKEYNMPFISHYLGSTDYMVKANASFSDINADGTHPSTTGYDVMWKTIQMNLGFVSDPSEWYRGNKEVYIYSDGAGYNRVANDSPITAFKPGLSYDITASTGTGGFPDSKAGVLVTFRPSKSDLDLWGWQEYHVYGSVDTYKRYWNGTVWTAFSKLTFSSNGEFRFINFASGIDPSAPISTYGEKTVRYDVVTNSQSFVANFPEGKGGLLTTVRQFNALDGWSYQTYAVYQTNNVYRRYWTGNAWSAWKRISGNLSLTTAARNALSATWLSKGDQVFDETLNKPIWRNKDNNGWVDATGTTV